MGVSSYSYRGTALLHWGDFLRPKIAGPQRQILWFPRAFSHLCARGMDFAVLSGLFRHLPKVAQCPNLGLSRGLEPGDKYPIRYRE